MPVLDFADYPLPIVFVASLLAILGASEIGRRLGARGNNTGGGSLSTLEAANLGLLALMLGFTFSMALSRYEARRDAVVGEANEIGTTALRARLLPPPRDAETLALLRQYVDLRVELTRRTPTEADVAAVIAKSNAIQEALWQQATAVAAMDNAIVPTGLFIQSLNSMIDAQDTRVAALRNSVPAEVILTLYLIAIVSAGFAGYADGREKSTSRIPIYVVGATVAAVILMIQDLDRPVAGYITIDQRPMLDLAAGLASKSD